MSRDSASETAFKQKIADLQKEKDALAHDLYKLRREKYALASQLHRQEQALHASLAGFIIWNIPNAELEISFPWKKVIGEEVDESKLDYAKLSEWLQAADRFSIKRMIFELLHQKAMQRQRLVHIMQAQGERTPMVINASAITDENGQPFSIAFHLFVPQINQLFEEKSQYLNIDLLPLPLLRIQSHNGEILSFNHVARSIFKDRLDDQDIQHISDIVGNDVWLLLKQKIHAGTLSLTREFSLDSERHFILHASFFATYVDILFTDISEVQLSVKELKQVNIQLDNFVYHASHDLRGPLRTVLGLLDILKIETNKEQREHCVSLIEGSIKRLDSLVVDLLSISRNRRIANPKVKINFMSEVDHAIAGFYHLGNTRNLDIRVMVTQPTEFVADLTRVRIVMNNIISNAIKYRRFLTSPSYVEIRIRVDDSAAHIIVEDNGEGISEEQLPRIFDMFYRASDQSEGSGLGLYIVKDVLQKLEGHIEIDSEFGEGTTVKIMIPNRQ